MVSSFSSVCNYKISWLEFYFQGDHDDSACATFLCIPKQINSVNILLSLAPLAATVMAAGSCRYMPLSGRPSLKFRHSMQWKTRLHQFGHAEVCCFYLDSALQNAL